MQEDEQKLLSNITKMVAQLKELHDLAYVQYSKAVDAVLKQRIVEEKQVEHLLDGILSFGDDARFVELMKKVCRYVYAQHPQLVGDYVYIFRSLYMDNEGESNDGDD